jgi:hypothetical protein
MIPKNNITAVDKQSISFRRLLNEGKLMSLSTSIKQKFPKNPSGISALFQLV